MMATTRRTAMLLASIVLAATALPRAIAQSPDAAGERRVAIVSLAEGGAAVYAATLADAAARELAALGFTPERLETARRDEATIPDTEASGEATRAREIAAAANARWAALVRCTIEGRRLTWRLSVYDSRDGALVAADAGSAFAGASSVTSLEASARTVAAKAALALDRSLPAGLVESALSFASSDDGAELRLGDERGPILGVVNGQRLESDYLPFIEGQALTLSLSKEGYWPATLVVQAGQVEGSLPRLMRKTKLSAGLGASLNRLAGLSGELRYYPLSDSLFTRIGLQAWLRDDYLSGSPPSLHAEGRLGGAAYLALPPGSRFRVSAGLGVAVLVTMLNAEASRPNAYLDLSLELPSITLEWHWPGFAIYLEERIGYSLGLPMGLLARGWWRTGAGPLALTMGAMVKWP